MTKEELTQKLEKIKLPEIELLSHKQKLRRFLMSRYSIEQKRREILAFLRPVLVGGFALAILLAAIFNASFFTRPSLALAKEIALRDPRIRSLVDQGAIIKETQLADKKGYLLLGLRQFPVGPAPLKSANILAKDSAFLVEVDFKDKKVSELKELFLPEAVFSKEEENKIKEISQKSELVKKEIPEKAQIQKIEAKTPQLKLIKKGKKIEVQPERGATIIYKDESKTWKSEINLDKAKVEAVEFLGEEDNSQ